MAACSHTNLTLLPAKANKIRCLHCHLTIDPDELGGQYCPECYEIHGKKQWDFEPVEPDTPEAQRYRCEDCGAFIGDC